MLVVVVLHCVDSLMITYLEHITDLWLLPWDTFFRSAAVVTAFLMKSKGWRLAQSFQWVKDRRPQVQLTEGNSICSVISLVAKIPRGY